jgi:phage tail sheath protein FI
VDEKVSPGRYVEETRHLPGIEGAPTDVVGFVGTAAQGLADEPVEVASWDEFAGMFGGPAPGLGLPYAVRDFFDHGGGRAVVVRVEGTGVPTAGRLSATPEGGLYALDRAGRTPSLLALPVTEGGDLSPEAAATAYAWCAGHRAVLLLDPPSAWASAADIPADPGAALGAAGPDAAVYWPRPRRPDPLQPGRLRTGSVTGVVAGVVVRTDRAQGPWQAPAGTEASTSVTSLAATVTDRDQALLNQRGVNCLRRFPGRGVLVWGARTLSPDPEWRYLPVRRLALFIRRSLENGLAWAVLEPLREPTFTRVRSACEAFLADLWRRGAFPGRLPSEAYYVRCGRDTMTLADTAAGRLVVLVGIAPLRPREFTVLRLELTLS